MRPMMRAQFSSDANKPHAEWQQYLDRASGRHYYVNLETAERRWERPEWFYPAGQGIDENPMMVALRSDRLSANPYRPVPTWLKVLNAGLLTGLLSYFVYLYATHDPSAGEVERKRREAAPRPQTLDEQFESIAKSQEDAQQSKK